MNMETRNDLIKAKSEMLELLEYIHELENKPISRSQTMTPEESVAEVWKGVESSCEPLGAAGFDTNKIDAIKSFVGNVIVELFAKKESK